MTLQNKQAEAEAALSNQLKRSGGERVVAEPTSAEDSEMAKQIQELTTKLDMATLKCARTEEGAKAAAAQLEQVAADLRVELESQAEALLDAVREASNLKEINVRLQASLDEEADPAPFQAAEELAALAAEVSRLSAALEGAAANAEVAALQSAEECKRQVAIMAVDLRRQLETEVSAEKQDLHIQLAVVKKALQDKEEQLAKFRRAARESKERIVTLDDNALQMADQAADAQAEITRLQAGMVGLQSELSAAHVALSAHHGSQDMLSRLESENAALREELRGSTTKEVASRSDDEVVQILRQENAELRETARSLRVSLKATEANLQREQSTLRAANADLKRTTDDGATILAQLEGALTKLGAQVDENQSLSERVALLLAQLELAVMRQREAEEAVSMLERSAARISGNPMQANAGGVEEQLEASLQSALQELIRLETELRRQKDVFADQRTALVTSALSSLRHLRSNFTRWLGRNRVGLEAGTDAGSTEARTSTSPVLDVGLDELLLLRHLDVPDKLHRCSSNDAAYHSAVNVANDDASSGLAHDPILLPAISPRSPPATKQSSGGNGSSPRRFKPLKWRVVPASMLVPLGHGSVDIAQPITLTGLRDSTLVDAVPALTTLAAGGSQRSRVEVREANARRRHDTQK